MEKPPTPITIKDLAKYLDLSVSTVSYALNGGPRSVSEEVKERVRQAAAELEYRPSRIARSMVTRTTHTIGIVPTSVRNHALLSSYHQVCISAFAMVSEEMGYDLLYFTRLENLRGEAVVRSILDGRIDGVIFLNPEFDLQVLKTVSSAGMPVAVLSRKLSLPIPQFRSDNREGVVKAMQHLYDLGHRRIANLRGWKNHFDAQERTLAYREFMRSHGLPIIERDGRFEQSDAMDATLDLLRSSRPPTAIFTGNDGAAIGVYLAAMQMGIKIPDDLSVVGFDDTYLAGVQTPPLTTIRQPIERMARDAVRSVVDRLNGEIVLMPSVYPTELVIRQSTCPAVK